MRIGIVGGGGFIGSWLFRELSQMGHDIVIVDNMSFMKRDRGLTMEMVDKTLRFREKLMGGSQMVYPNFEDMPAVDYIVHLAADAVEYPAGDERQYLQFVGDNDINIKVVRYCMRHHVPMLFMSSIFAIGDFLDKADEEVPLEPTTTYGNVKASCEHLMKAYLEEYAIIRSTSVYGVGDLNNRATSAIMRAALYGTGVRLNTHSKMQFTYVENLVKILAATINDGRVGTWNIVDDAYMNLVEFAQAVKSVTGAKFAIEEYSVKDRPDRGELDTLRMKTYFSGVPQKKTEEAIKEYWNQANDWGVA